MAIHRLNRYLCRLRPSRPLQRIEIARSPTRPTRRATSLIDRFDKLSGIDRFDKLSG
jgi:hypothetical protein